MKHTPFFYKSSERGVTLLIAVLLASVTLAVGLGVYQRTYKEMLFASFWKQAQSAFASADGALECAMYFELHPLESPQCFNNSIVGWNPSIPGNFSINASGVCAEVYITSTGTSTTTKAYGYNTCTVTDPRRVERGLELTYGL
jgi:hypothetical protein